MVIRIRSCKLSNHLINYFNIFLNILVVVLFFSVHFCTMNAQELENRLINFSSAVINFVQSLPNTKAANQLGGQLLRSATSASLNYGEAQSGESRRDFIHKMKIITKELRESHICLKTIHRSIALDDSQKLVHLIDEANQLVAIFVKSVKTSEQNHKH
jgi:four helix bundle protein